MRLRMRVVFPEPRKPVMMVMGMGAILVVVVVGMGIVRRCTSLENISGPDCCSGIKVSPADDLLWADACSMKIPR